MYRLIFIRAASIMALAVFCQTTSAQLVLELTGTPGSNVISYTASGSYTSVANVNAAQSFAGGNALLPTPNSWSQSFDNELGDVLIDNSFATNRNDDLSLSVAVPIFLNGIQLDSTPLGASTVVPNSAVFDTIDLDQDNTNGDDIELDPTGNIVYPALAVGDVITWGPTSGTFTLDENNFDDIFNLGTFTNDFGNYTVIVNSVPEPSSLLFLLGAGAATLCVRRRS